MGRAALAWWVLAASALAGAPGYDAFSEPDGEIATVRQELAAWAMVRDPEQLEAVYADASKGRIRAVHVVQQLEATLASSGREVAERVSRPGCLVPGYKELSKTCRPDWSFLDFLSKDRPGGVALRAAIFSAFAQRARERNLENEAILSAINGLLSLELAGAMLRGAKVPTSTSKAPGPPLAPEVPGARGGPPSGAPLASSRVAGVGASTADDLAAAAARARAAVGAGQGPVYGTHSHSAFRAEVEALGRGDLSTEVSYLNGRVVPTGTTGSVRLDVVEGPLSAPTAVYDLKTGSATLTPTRINEIRSHLPGGSSGIPILEIR